MPKRNKLQRNPRVKNRVKFEKAKKRRKGAIREVNYHLKKIKINLFNKIFFRYFFHINYI